MQTSYRLKRNVPLSAPKQDYWDLEKSLSHNWWLITVSFGKAGAINWQQRNEQKNSEGPWLVGNTYGFVADFPLIQFRYYVRYVMHCTTAPQMV